MDRDVATEVHIHSFDPPIAEEYNPITMKGQQIPDRCPYQPERSPLENIEEVPIEEVDEAAESALTERHEMGSDDQIGDENEEFGSQNCILEELNESDEEDEAEEELDEDSGNKEDNQSQLSDGAVMEFAYNPAISPKPNKNVKEAKGLPRTSLEHMRIKKIESSSEGSDKEDQLIEEIKLAALHEQGTMAFGSIANYELPQIADLDQLNHYDRKQTYSRAPTNKLTKFSEIFDQSNHVQFQKTLVEKVNEHQRSLLQMQHDIEKESMKNVKV